MQSFAFNERQSKVGLRKPVFGEERQLSNSGRGELLRKITVGLEAPEYEFSNHQTRQRFRLDWVVR